MKKPICALVACTVLAGSSQLRAVELLAYFDFNDDSNPAEASELSGNALNATLVGSAAFTADMGGFSAGAGDRALDLTAGANAAAIVGTGLHFDAAFNNDAMTVTFWLFNNANANSSAYWINSPDATTSNFRGNQVHAPWGNGTVFFDTAGCCAANTQRISSAATAAATGVWQHWAVVKNGGDKRIYINGALEPNLNQVGGADPFLPFDGQLTIGAEFRPVGTDPVNSMNALIDDFAIFDEELSEADITDLASGARSPADLIVPPTDTDDDGLPDDYEQMIIDADPGDAVDGLDDVAGPNDAPATTDFDNDGSSDAAEFANRTDPLDPDSDDDGLLDGVEDNGGIYQSDTETGTDPNDPDTDGDGLRDGVESNTGIFVSYDPGASPPLTGTGDTGTDPNNADTDGDRDDDGEEATTAGRDPNVSDRPPPPPGGLLAYYNFEGQSEDQSGNGVHATLQGSAAISAAGDGFLGNGQSLDLGVVGDGAAATTDPGSHFDSAFDNNAMAVTFWQINTGIGNSSAFWVHAPTSDGNQRGFQAHTPWGDGTVYFDQSGCCTGPQRLTIGGVVIENQWQHFVFQRDGDGNREIWVDGALVATAIGAEDFDPFDGILTIGAEGNGLNNSFGGRIDELAIFDQPLAPDRIAELAAGASVLNSNALNPLGLAVRGMPGNMLELSWNSAAGQLYNIRGESEPADAPDPLTWGIVMADLPATPPRNTMLISIDPVANPFGLFVVEEFPTPPTKVFTDDFESGQGGWTTGSDGAAGTDWELGTPDSALVGGPPAANSGANVFGTDLDATYVDLSNIWLRSPPVDLTGVVGGALVYQRWIDIENLFDAGSVRVLDASDSSEIAVLEDEIEGSTADWEEARHDLPAEAFGKMVIFEWRLMADDFTGLAGFYIDDVCVEGNAP